MNVNHLLCSILRGRYSFPPENEISNEAKDCVTQLMSIEPTNRLNGTSLSMHPWITQFAEDKKEFSPEDRSTKTIHGTVKCLSGGRTMSQIGIPSITLTPNPSQTEDMSKKVAFATLSNPERSFEIDGLVSFFSADAEFMSIRHHALNTVRIIEGEHIVIQVHAVLREIQDLDKDGNRALTLSKLIGGDIEKISPQHLVAASTDSFSDLYDVVRGSRRYCDLGLAHEARRKSDGRKFFVKVIQKKSLTPADEIRLAQELKILGMMKDDRNVVDLEQCFDSSDELRLVFPYYDGGSLEDMIDASPNRRLDEATAAKIVSQLGQVLQRLHTKSICHRNICPEHVLFGADGAVVLIDFFSADYLRVSAEDHVMHDLCGCSHYCAPEMLRYSQYGVQVDFWSLGVLSYLMLCGSLPF